MHRQIKWAELPQDRKTLLSKPITPFEKGQIERPLRITFHSSALKALSAFEKTALDVLREFASVESPNLLAFDTDSGNLPCIEIGRQVDDVSIPITIKYSEERYSSSAIMFPNQLADLAAQMVSNLGEDSSNNEQALQDLIVASAHHSIGQDILVTTSKWLLGNRNLSFVEDKNPYPPSETLKIMGLLFRTRSDFRYGSIVSCDRWLFYNRFVAYKLPAMGRYFRACLYSKVLPEDDIAILGQSISMRCVRAIQACDEIGRLFYVDQNNNVQDETMYHFDYLTLLLSGALDAQARVAYRAYLKNQSKVPSERTFKFHKLDDVAQIKRFDPQLANFLESDYFKDISGIITYMRNTIHGASLTTSLVIVNYDNKKSYTQIPESDAEKIWTISEKYGSAEAWGLSKLPGMTFFEPYAFSQQLVDHTLKIVNTIASLTKVENLFDSGAQIPDLSDPPDDDTFIRERIALLI